MTLTAESAASCALMGGMRFGRRSNGAITRSYRYRLMRRIPTVSTSRALQQHRPRRHDGEPLRTAAFMRMAYARWIMRYRIAPSRRPDKRAIFADGRCKRH